MEALHKDGEDGDHHKIGGMMMEFTVAKGFKQIHGIDCDETFSLVVMLKYVQILLAIIAYFDYEV
jgi:hypothetical protein